METFLIWNSKLSLNSISVGPHFFKIIIKTDLTQLNIPEPYKFYLNMSISLLMIGNLWLLTLSKLKIRIKNSNFTANLLNDYLPLRSSLASWITNRIGKMAGSCTFAESCANTVTFQLNKCEKDTFPHLRMNGSSISNISVPESALILYRAGVFSLTSKHLERSICSSHRDQLGLYWYRTTRVCQHPYHGNSSCDYLAQCSNVTLLWFTPDWCSLLVSE